MFRFVREEYEKTLRTTATEWHQCSFRPGRSTTEQISLLQKIFDKSWEYAKDVHTCFVDLEKAYDRGPQKNIWGVLC